MNAIELLTHQLAGSAQMFKRTLEDLSDDDCLHRPVAGANHPLWQLGHLCNAEVSMLTKFAGAAMPELPAGFAERFNNKNNQIDDPGHWCHRKQELIDLFDRVRAATVAHLKTLSEADLDRPTGFPMAPTLGAVFALQSGHTFMHMGQCQVARRKLGKPIIF